MQRSQFLRAGLRGGSLFLPNLTFAQVLRPVARLRERAQVVRPHRHADVGVGLAPGAFGKPVVVEVRVRDEREERLVVVGRAGDTGSRPPS